MADTARTRKLTDAADATVESPCPGESAHELEATATSAPPTRTSKKRQASDITTTRSSGPSQADSSPSAVASSSSDQGHGSESTGQSHAVTNSSSQQARGTTETTVGRNHHAATTMIKDLTPTTTIDWTVHARVVARGPVRKWENLRGGGTLQELFLVDKKNDFIRATLFNDAVLKFADTTSPGSACSLSRGKIKFAISGPNAFTRETYLSFGDNAEIHLLDAQALDNIDPDIPCTPLAQLTHLPAKAAVNVIGILLQATSTKRVVSAHGKNLQKRELVLVDDSNTRLLCTLWGNNARDEVAEAEGQPVLIKGGQLDDYMGARSVAAGIGSSFLVAPTLPRADELVALYDAGVDHTSFPIVPSP